MTLIALLKRCCPRCCLAAVLLALSACASEPRRDTVSYRVQSGDTLYAIARKHDLDYRDLALWNGLKPPYTLQAGQTLNLRRTVAAVAPVAASSARQYTVVRGDTLYAIAWRYGLDFRQLAEANRLPPPYTIFPGQRLQIPAAGTATGTASTRPAASTTPARSPSSAQGGSSSSTAKPVSPPRQSAPVAAVSGERWSWPSNGEVIGRFSTTHPVNKGIDIAGQRGQPVQAARSGRVVYAGSGMAGYGRLLIIKHDETFLSAYAHNDSLLVKEGDEVKAGQKIATLGDSGAQRLMLHFEIRRGGQPVNPLSYLPAR